MRKRRSQRDRHAFTLTELLVVIAVIGILASLLLPALSRSKNAALATECRGNLRDLGLALRMHLDEDRLYPATSGTGLLGFNDIYGMLFMTEWKETLIPHLGLQGERGDSVSRLSNMRKLRCPQVVRKDDGARGNGQYAYNAAGTGKFYTADSLGLGGRLVEDRLQATPESDVRMPADMIVAGDVAPGSSMSSPPGFPFGKTFNSSDYFDVCSSKPSLWPGTSHNSKASMLFGDGHVETARQTNWVSSSETARRRWNNDHQPHPETWDRP